MAIDWTKRNKYKKPILNFVPKNLITLEMLVAQINSQSMHEVFDWGDPVGKEVW